ncbi:hypothetical protein [Oleomonas cavernae]|uniref:hypothetical protein n=1 Tax=Oleomonas cavernae TaxID=2320859 RepID=UPI000E6C0154|nr:hypothetical protein [Oleomonas cavernae]
MHPAFVAIAITGLALAACAQRREAAPAPDPTAPARAAFGDHMEPFQGQPLDEMLAVFGPPSSRRPAQEGGEVVAWARKGETTVDGRVIPQDCTVTAFVDTKGLVSGIFGGGNILYCSKSFVPLPQALRPAAALPPLPPVIGQ